jgi:hypothetical protein
MHLPNAILGQYYTCELPVSGDKLVIQGLEDVGLVFDPVHCRLEGSPQTAGDFELRVDGAESADAGGLASAEGKVIVFFLSVFPNPRSLWVAQPSDPTILFAKADSQHHALSHAGLRVLCASQRGRAHAQAGAQREDEALVAAIQGQDWIVAVVADGAGSAGFSREGSRLACTCVVAYLQVQPPIVWQELAEAFYQWLAGPSAERTAVIEGRLQALLQGALTAAITAIRDAAAQAEQPEHAFATTLSLSLVHAMPQGGYALAAWGIGDSPIVLLNTIGYPDVLHMPEEGDYGGETTFLPAYAALHTLPGLLRRTHWRILPRFQVIVLMSDGIYDPFFEGRDLLWRTDLWASLWAEWQPALQSEDPAAQLLAWLDFWRVGHHDDRSLALILPMA